MLSVEEIQKMSYTDFIALIRETNRCPGGKDTIRQIVQNSFVDSESKILDVGSNTGFTSLELAHITKSSICGIDVSKSCVEIANELLSNDIESVRNRVKFKVGSAYDIPFENNMFDLVVTGGATSFMGKKQEAVSEYKRVLKPWGFLSVTQLFYEKTPPASVVNAVSEAIGIKVNAWTEEDWKKVFEENQDDINLELYYYKKQELQSREKEVIDDYIEYFLRKDHLVDLDEKLREAIRKKWRYYIDVFNENHKYLGYFIALFRKTHYPEEPELFIRK